MITWHAANPPTVNPEFWMMTAGRHGRRLGRCRNFVASIGLLCALLCAATSPALARPKTDILVLLNGDRITGEVKGLKRGKLKFKTDSTGTVYIEWDDIESVTSTYTFEIELEDGTRYFGTLQKGTDGAEKIVGDAGETQLAMIRIIRITPIEQRFWKALDGSLSAGMNYTQSSKVSAYYFDASTTYQTRRFRNSTSFQFNLTQSENDDEDLESTTRADLAFVSQRLFKERWFTFAMGAAQNNEELGIDLRLLGAYGAGRHIVRTDRSDFMLAGGAAVNQEQVAEGEPSETSAELVGIAGYTIFRYDDPEVDLTTDLEVFPSVTEYGRVRLEYSVSLKYELVNDFFWNLSAFDSFDNKPRAEDAHTNDWGVVMSFGWTF